MIEVEPILNEAVFLRTLAEVRELMRSNPADGSPDAHRYEILSLMVEAFEKEHHPIDDSLDPIDLIKERIREKGMTRIELASMLGGHNHVSGILGRQRPLTLDMVRRLSAALNVSADALIRPYKLRHQPPTPRGERLSSADFRRCAR